MDSGTTALTLDQLRLFVCVAEQGSFSAAGRKLGRVQSAISYGVANLEQILDVQLFDRSGRRPQLTERGRGLLTDARQVLSQVGQFQSRAASVAQGLESDVSVAVDAIFPTSILIKLCRAFQNKFPSVSLRVHTEVLDAVAALISDGTCHLGVTGPVADQPNLDSRFLCRVALVPVAASCHSLSQTRGAIATSDVRDKVQIVISRQVQQPGGDHSVLSRLTWRVADATTKLALIRAGLGWGNLPLDMVRDDLKSKRLVRLELEQWGPEPIMAALSSVVRVDAPPGPAGQWLRSQLEQLCTEPCWRPFQGQSGRR